jgi:hypothetical protein
VLRSLHSSEKRDIRAKVLPALIACTTETQRVWRQEVGDESSRARGYPDRAFTGAIVKTTTF